MFCCPAPNVAVVMKYFPKVFFLFPLIFLLATGWCNATDNPSSELQELHREIKALYKSAKDAEAIALAQKAVALGEQIHGVEHPNLAESLYDLARGFTRTGQYARAEPLYRRVLKIREKAGSRYPQTSRPPYALGWFCADLATTPKPRL